MKSNAYQVHHIILLIELSVYNHNAERDQRYDRRGQCGQRYCQTSRVILFATRYQPGLHRAVLERGARSLMIDPVLINRICLASRLQT